MRILDIVELLSVLSVEVSGSNPVVAECRPPDWPDGLTPNLGSHVGEHRLVGRDRKVVIVKERQVVEPANPTFETPVPEVTVENEIFVQIFPVEADGQFPGSLRQTFAEGSGLEDGLLVVEHDPAELLTVEFGKLYRPDFRLDLEHRRDVGFEVTRPLVRLPVVVAAKKDKKPFHALSQATRFSVG